MCRVQLEQAGQAGVSGVLDGGQQVQQAGDHTGVHDDRLSRRGAEVEASHWTFVARGNVNHFVLWKI